MKTLKRITLFLLLLLMAPGVAVLPAAAQSSEAGGDAPAAVRNAIADVNQQFEDSWAEGDAAGVAALYTDDAWFLAPGFPIMKGREAVERYVSGGIESGLARIDLETVELEARGDRAVEIGQYTLETPGGQIADEGKYLVVWMRDGGTWKLHRDMMNTSQGGAGN